MDQHYFYEKNIFPLFEHLYKSLILEMKIRHENQVNEPFLKKTFY
jgi:hypothetical protein